MTWRSNPPSQYMDVKKGGVPFWALLLISVVCLALGFVAGLTMRDDDQLADPRSDRASDRRTQLVNSAHEKLAAASQLDAATNVDGAPSSFGLVRLGREVRDVCVTGQHGFLVNDWYNSACGVKVTWYFAARRGGPATLEEAARARFDGGRIPTVKSFTPDETSGPLPNELSGKAHAAQVTSPESLHSFQRAARLTLPAQDAVYHDAVRTIDLASAYREQADGRPTVVRMSLVAQYART